MHVFLTGPVQIGKSTLIAAALDAIKPERLGGGSALSRQSRRRMAAGLFICILPQHRICSAMRITASASAARRSASRRFQMRLRRRDWPRWRMRRTVI